MAWKILIVDDHDDARKILALQLRYLGYEAIEAVDDRDALRKAIEEKPQLIITDMGGPAAVGAEAMTEIRENPETASIPVIACTEWVSHPYKENALRAGVTAYLVKPVSAQLLRNVIETLA